MFASGVFISGESSVDVDPIAIEMAKLVFSKLFSEVLISTEEASDGRGAAYLLKLETAAKTSGWDGNHTAEVKAALYDENESLILETQTKKVIYYWRYAQEEPMQRAFLAAYQDIARQIRDKLLGEQAGSPPASVD